MRPDPPQPRDVEELFAALETGLHPRVLCRQLAASTLSVERTATGVDGPYIVDELGQIPREHCGSARVVVGGHDTRYPGLHRPWHRVAGARFADRDRLRRREPGTAEQLARRLRFGLQP